MFTKVIVLALATLAVAAPKGGQEKYTCGENSTVHCCNTETANKLNGQQTLPIDAEILKSLIGQCNKLNVLLIQDLVNPFQKACSQSTVCCGDNKQNGVINFGCTSLTA